MVRIDRLLDLPHLLLDLPHLSTRFIPPLTRFTPPSDSLSPMRARLHKGLKEIQGFKAPAMRRAASGFAGRAAAGSPFEVDTTLDRSLSMPPEMKDDPDNLLVELRLQILERRRDMGLDPAVSRSLASMGKPKPRRRIQRYRRRTASWRHAG